MYFIGALTLLSIVQGSLCVARETPQQKLGAWTALQPRQHQVYSFPAHDRRDARNTLNIRSHPLSYHTDQLVKRAPLPAPAKQKQILSSTGGAMYRGSDRRAAAKSNQSQSQSSPKKPPPPTTAWAKTRGSGAMDVVTGHGREPRHRNVSPQRLAIQSASHPRKAEAGVIAHPGGKGSAIATGQKASSYAETLEGGSAILQSYGSGGVETKIVANGGRDNIQATSRSGRPVSASVKLYGGEGGALGGARAEN